MNVSFPANSAWVVLFLACASCSDDPELVAKRELQRTEIARLQGDVALAEERLRNMPEDKGEDLKAAEKQLNELASEANKLDAEIAELQQRKADLEKELAQYKEKYPLN
jgi:septal ring factor EnvC (AmiA/AmiB activator)